MKLRDGLVYAVLIALPWATSVQEVGLALLLAWALVDGRWRSFLAAPWAAPALVLAVVYTLGSLASGVAREGIGHAWLLAPLLALAGLPKTHPGWPSRAVVGVGAACAAAVYGVVQAAQGLPVHGALSHHLTFAYALLPPLGVAASLRWWPAAALIAAGVLATGSEAAPIALLATLAALLVSPFLALAGGVALSLAGLPFAEPSELQQRAVLWTGGLSLPAASAGAGGYAQASIPAYDALSPGFYFPNHAHDSFIQLRAVLGGAGWLATLGVLATAFSSAPRPAVAGLVGITVGALTQDTFGDLEVARAAWVWLALGASVSAATLAGPASSTAPPASEASAAAPSSNA